MASVVRCHVFFVFLQSEQKVLAPILRQSRIKDEALAAVGTPTVYAGTARRLAETGKGGRKRKRPSRLRLQTLGVNGVCLKVTSYSGHIFSCLSSSPSPPRLSSSKHVSHRRLAGFPWFSLHTVGVLVLLYPLSAQLFVLAPSCLLPGWHYDDTTALWFPLSLPFTFSSPLRPCPPLLKP